MKKIDYIVTAVFAIIMIILYFFGFCDLDIIVLLFGAIVLCIILVVWHRQAKKYDRIEEQNIGLKKRREALNKAQ